ncbi:hypothetical protein Ga0100230_023545 [Opitutaceae bacterium TAV3]|nr:hypothetical protein Ga0100230_023545 [Opitutaceae bacterium TAV3]
MEPCELERMERLWAAHPDCYIPNADSDSIGITEYNGITAVWNCPCGWLERSEKFLWTNRAAIIEYYKARTARELAEASANAAALDGVSNTTGPVGEASPETTG